MTMEPQLKQRLVGAAVLVGLGVVFIPILLDQSDDTAIAPEPAVQTIDAPTDFSSRVVPLDDEAVAQLESKANATADELQRAEDWDKKPLSTRPAVVATDSTPAPEENEQLRTGVTAWVVQLGSFASRENAAGLVATLKKSGYTAFIEENADGDKVSYRVRVGPELTKVVAEEIRDKLNADTKVKGIVMRYP